MDHPNVCFLQNFVGGGRISAQPAEVAMKKASGAQVESLLLGLPDLLAGARFNHRQVA
jgi:hypothetical protein